MQGLIKEALGSLYDNSRTKRVEITREVVEKDHTFQQNPFVKRIFTKKVKFQKTTRTFPSVPTPLSPLDCAVNCLLHEQ